jgi:hypothetical protein
MQWIQKFQSSPLPNSEAPTYNVCVSALLRISRSWRKRRERKTLERSFKTFEFTIGKRDWMREDLHARS